MKNLIKKYKKIIDKNSVLEIKKVLAKLDQSEWLLKYHDTFTTQITYGKTVRGSLFLIFLEKFGIKIKKEHINLATAMEFIQTGLVIQDDVMDQDEYRRQHKTIHFELRENFKENNILNYKQNAESIAYCIGDIYFFAAMQFLSNPKIKNIEKISQLFSLYYTKTGFGQIRDVYMSASPDFYSFEDISQMYEYKTSYYTIVLPVLSACLVANKNKEFNKKIEEITKLIGIIFQMQDDYLNIYGEESQTGKSTGSDITENKSTIFKAELLTLAKNDRDALKFLNYFGKKISKNDLTEIKDFFEKSKILEKIQEKISETNKNIDKKIANLKSTKKIKTTLSELKDLVYKRNA